MVNRVNVQKALDIMRRVDENQREFDLRVFANTPVYPKTEETAEACGTACCFSGWVNLSPEWRKQRGIDEKSSAALYEHHKALNEAGPAASMAEWLGIDIETAMGLIYNRNKFYGVEGMRNVTLCHVIDKLEQILANSETTPPQRLYDKVKGYFNRG
jgi:hypothetical protein